MPHSHSVFPNQSVPTCINGTISFTQAGLEIGKLHFDLEVERTRFRRNRGLNTVQVFKLHSRLMPARTARSPREFRATKANPTLDVFLT